MFTPSRDEVRQFFCSVWQKRQARLPLSGAELPAADILACHPEYHALLDNPAQALDREWTPEDGETNPFLHLSLHLAIAEQLAIDQPPGIRAAFTRLAQTRDAHAAGHVLLECLGEVLWAAQKEGKMPNSTVYLDKVRTYAMRKVGN